MDKEKLLTAPLMNCFPHIFGRNEAVPEDIVGATIISIGTFEDSDLVEGGGLEQTTLGCSVSRGYHRRRFAGRRV
jgi:hypothetical protein